jgi:hypothetical protein
MQTPHGKALLSALQNSQLSDLQDVINDQKAYPYLVLDDAAILEGLQEGKSSVSNEWEFVCGFQAPPISITGRRPADDTPSDWNRFVIHAASYETPLKISGTKDITIQLWSEKMFDFYGLSKQVEWVESSKNAESTLTDLQLISTDTSEIQDPVISLVNSASPLDERFPVITRFAVVYQRIESPMVLYRGAERTCHDLADRYSPIVRDEYDLAIRQLNDLFSHH